MKTLRAGIAAILLVATMGITFSGCSGDSDLSSASGNAETTNSADANAAADADKNNEDSKNENADNKNDNTTSEHKSTGVKAEDIDFSIDPDADLEDVLVHEVTFDWGGSDDDSDTQQDPVEPAQTYIVTEYVPVTEPNGETATDNAGEAVTEVVTQIQTEPVEHIPAMDNFRSYWIDMWNKTEDGEYNKTFNGEFLVVTFKIKDNTPAGNYAITMNDLDFVNWEEQQLDVKTVDGYITVGEDTIPTAPGQAQPGQFTIQAMGAKGNVGDEVEVVFNVNDNPGLVAYIFNFQYDKNALQIVDARLGDDCAPIIGSLND